jgi:tetratricopeptide (TPR) repeat protein
MADHLLPSNQTFLMVKLFSIFGVTMLFGFFVKDRTITTGEQIENQSAQELYQYKILNSVGCSPDFGGPYDDISIPLLKGWGNHTMKISTNNDSAFLYFNQGINMFYAFHFIEARASFKKAQDFDSSCAVAYLGEALTYGPNINNPAYKLRSYVLTLIEKTKQFEAHSSEFEKALIDAQVLRYTADTSESFQKVNEIYADIMKDVCCKFPANSDAAALYTDALMQLHPWDLYDNVGNPKPWDSYIEGEITKLIKRFPDHPGLNHYYIHCVEASNTADRGLESARKLQRLTPGLSHMIHMSSHIYIRTGYYADGVRVNEKAIDAYEQYKKIFPDVQRYSGIYYTHNLSMAFANALFLPNYKTAARLAHLRRTWLNSSRRLTDSLTNGEQYSYCLPYLAWIRYGKWDSILAEHNIPTHLIYAGFMQHFAKGMAFARTHRLSESLEELSATNLVINHPDLQIHPTGENAPVSGSRVAISILKGIIAEEQGNYNEAIFALKQAVAQEDAMEYNEPKDWFLPARQYLGESLMKAKLFSKAEKIFKEDLKLNPKNVWSLSGLFHALSQQHKTAERKIVDTQLKKASTGKDIQIDHAVF